MAHHHRTVTRSHSLTRRVKVAAVVAAAGAIAVAGVQFGAGAADAQTLQLPAGVLPAGVQLPTIEVPNGPVADWAAGFAVPLGPGSAAPSPVHRTVQPVSGTLSSGYGARWGTQHGGIDIAASIGTPILAAADGEVISAGPASGFGQWVRIRHDDGTITVYGHVDTYSVHVGQRVAAGQQIATVGNRGESTGPHLHFETWNAAGSRINPNDWLGQRGVVPNWGS
ncbi:M23 family metallopeptidase [Rhodococcus sp. NPDC003318]|uniref:M23 family metallopeptidase n=1 Tax=Rhodococcus sp. NPDC003318 TaxID=3364503 RepID=UPI00369BC8D2